MAVFNISEFQNFHRIQSYSFEPTENAQRSTAIGGHSFRASRGPRLWSGSVTCSAFDHRGQGQISAKMDKIQQVGNYFLFSPPLRSTPAAWKSGDNLSNAQIWGTQTPGYQLRVRGLPATYKITAGDYLSFLLNGVYRIYRVTDDAVASGGNVTLNINVPLQAGGLPANATAVQLINPLVTCQYIDGSYQPARLLLSHTEGYQFSFQQVLRV